ncbi:MAG: hypothetical protein AB7F25_13480 [Deferribacterales bacterium]
MVFDKKKLKEILAENEVKTTEDLQVFMREMMKEVIETLYEGELESTWTKIPYICQTRHSFSRLFIDSDERIDYLTPKQARP